MSICQGVCVNNFVNLIVSAGISENPTEILYFRHLIISAKYDLLLDCLIEAQQEMKDNYYKFLKTQGAMDKISAIVTPEEHENGIRLAEQHKYPLTIEVKYINCVNCTEILGRIKQMSNPPRFPTSY